MLYDFLQFNTPRHSERLLFRLTLSFWVLTCCFVASWILNWGTTDKVHAQSNQPANFPVPDDTEPLAQIFPLPSPTESVASLTLPKDFVATVFAAEPDVRNPIDLAWDFGGRIWVAENYTYAQSSLKFRDDLHDRVVVFEDDDQDGTPEKRTVFLDSLNRLTSVEVGRGGVWLMCPPRLLYVPDADHDAVPDGPPRTILDGFTVANQNYHNFANGLRFGPDGWLYGRCGGSCPGKIGIPGTPDADRISLEGGIWRYSIDQRRFEVICHGTTNPWGHDFNDVGELFFINTVNGHLWHGIHGAHFKRPFTLDPNLDAYELIDQHADHYHYDTTGDWRESRDGAAGDLGGGHAHSGMMIYREETWPTRYLGKLMTLNFHGRRANVERLVRRGTGYVGQHDDDFFISSDRWFRGMELSAGPDGNVFVLDWSDLGECHEHTGVHRNSGRIFKISHHSEGSPRFSPYTVTQELASQDPVVLVGYQSDSSRWRSRQARMRLVELARLRPNSEPIAEAIELLKANLAKKANQMKGNESDEAPEFFKALCSLSQIDPAFDARDWLHDDSPVVRGWAVRLFTETWPIDDCYGPTANSVAAWPGIRKDAMELIGNFAALKMHESPSLRLILASTLQRLPGDLRTVAAERLLALSGDTDCDDHNQAKLIWYGIMSRAAEHPDELLQIVKNSELPELTELIARSIGEQAEQSPELLDSLLQLHPNPSWCRAVLSGLSKGMVGIRSVPMPANWEAFRSHVLRNDDSLETVCQSFDKLFGEGVNSTELFEIVTNEDADIKDRLGALDGLVAGWHADGGDTESTTEILRVSEPLIEEARVNVAVARTLSTIPDIRVAELFVRRYKRFRGPFRPAVVTLLCGRAEYASVLVQAIENGKLGKEELSASHVRDLVALGNDELTSRLEVVWGHVHATSSERLAAIDRLKHILSPDEIATADASQGRMLFDRVCASCHVMFGTGEKIGPDLTGAQRTSLDYLLHNIIDPNAVVGANYRAKKILTVDGRLLVGLVAKRTRRTLTLASATRTETIPIDDIEDEFDTDQSPMPSGLLTPLTDVQIANLIKYLMSPIQVATPAE